MIDNINPNKPQVQITINNTTEIVCECGNNIFQEATLLRRASRILTGGPKDTIIPIPVPYCVKCFSPLDELLPEELRKKKFTLLP